MANICESCGVEYIKSPFNLTIQKYCSKACRAREEFKRNKQAAYDRVKRWSDKYPEKHRMHCQIRGANAREKVFAARQGRKPIKISTQQWRELCERSNGVCAICKNFFQIAELSLDHIIPFMKGGTNSMENIQPTCLPCNQRKARGSFIVE